MKHLVALVLANLFWAGNFVFGALAVRQLSPLELTWMRWLGAVPILALLAVVIDRPSPRAIVRDLPRQGVLALFGPIGFCLLSYEAMRHTTSLDAALVGAINPAIIAVCTAVLAGAMIAPRVAAGVVVSLVGVSGGRQGRRLDAARAALGRRRSMLAAVVTGPSTLSPGDGPGRPS